TEMVRALDESTACKQKEVFCACGSLHFDQIMNGMCCDSDTSCGCCSKDPTISKLPTVYFGNGIPKKIGYLGEVGAQTSASARVQKSNAS
uniref:P-type domain-containing protein n=1 Tax=Globodera pallida TaxID=36090 RepID=A0A183CRE1_GLOPA